MHPPFRFRFIFGGLLPVCDREYTWAPRPRGGGQCSASGHWHGHNIRQSLLSFACVFFPFLVGTVCFALCFFAGLDGMHGIHGRWRGGWVEKWSHGRNVACRMSHSHFCCCGQQTADLQARHLQICKQDRPLGCATESNQRKRAVPSCADLRCGDVSDS